MQLSAPQLKVQLIFRGKYPIGALREFLPYISGASAIVPMAASYCELLCLSELRTKDGPSDCKNFFSNPISLVHMLSYKVQIYCFKFYFSTFLKLRLTTINTSVPNLSNSNTVQRRTQKSKLIIFLKMLLPRFEIIV